MLNTLKHFYPAFETKPLLSMRSRPTPLLSKNCEIKITGAYKP